MRENQDSPENTPFTSLLLGLQLFFLQTVCFRQRMGLYLRQSIKPIGMISRITVIIECFFPRISISIPRNNSFDRVEKVHLFHLQPIAFHSKEPQHIGKIYRHKYPISSIVYSQTSLVHIQTNSRIHVLFLLITNRIIDKIIWKPFATSIYSKHFLLIPQGISPGYDRRITCTHNRR